MFINSIESQNNTKFKWITQKASGIRPMPRSGTSFALSQNNKVYCFGGVMDVEEDEENLQGQFGNELYCLDLSSIAWRQLEINKKEKVFTKDKESSMDASENENVVTTTSGAFTVTVKNTASTSVSYSNSSKSIRSNFPSPRMNAGLVICKGLLYLYGGIYEEDKKQCTLNDFYSLDFHKLNEWKVIIPNNLDAHQWYDSDSEKSSSESEESMNEDSDTSDSDSSEMDVE